MGERNEKGEKGRKKREKWGEDRCVEVTWKLQMSKEAQAVIDEVGRSSYCPGFRTYYMLGTASMLYSLCNSISF